MSLPFQDYPGRGRRLLGGTRGTVCRREYGLDFMRKTGQRVCAYCGADFTDSYRTWLTMALDHVVPAGVCKGLGIPAEWREDCSNKVLACAACNGFRNRYRPPVEPNAPMTLEAFYALRDRIFVERSARIVESHDADRAFFESKPWDR